MSAHHLVDRTRLEMLNLSYNRLGTLLGLASLPAMIALNLGECAHPVIGHRILLAPRLFLNRLRVMRILNIVAPPPDHRWHLQLYAPPRISMY